MVALEFPTILLNSNYRAVTPALVIQWKRQLQQGAGRTHRDARLRQTLAATGGTVADHGSVMTAIDRYNQVRNYYRNHIE